MPGYVSHTVMARDVYNKIDNKNINIDYMITFSLGGDLCKYSKCRKASHNIKQDEFIYNMADYLKENNLLNDKECLAVLYAHICHYCMDDVIHPLVRKIDKTCVKNKKNHTLIEGYYDNYLVTNSYGVRVDKYDNRLLFKGKLNKKVSNMIDYVYEKTYDTKDVSKYYKFNIWLYKKIKYLYRMFGIGLLKKFSGFNKFIKDNKNVDLFNNKNLITYKSYLRKEDNKSLDELYDESVNRAIKYINKINKYLKEDNICKK